MGLRDAIRADDEHRRSRQYPDDIIVLPRRARGGQLGGNIGDHVETRRGWGKIVALSAARSTMTVKLWSYGPWIEHQDFPEWRIARHFDRVAEQAHGSAYRNSPGERE